MGISCMEGRPMACHAQSVLYFKRCVSANSLKGDPRSALEGERSEGPRDDRVHDGVHLLILRLGPFLRPELHVLLPEHGRDRRVAGVCWLRLGCKRRDLGVYHGGTLEVHFRHGRRIWCIGEGTAGLSDAGRVRGDMPNNKTLGAQVGLRQIVGQSCKGS